VISLGQIVQSYRERLITLEQHTAQAIRSAHAHMLLVVMPHITPLLKQIGEAKAADNPVPLHWLYTGDKLGNVKHLVKSQVNSFGGNAKAQVLTAQTHGAGLGLQSAHAQLATVAPAHTIKTPPLSAGKIIGYTQQGKPIDDLMDGFGEEASDRVGKALIAGVSIGQQPDMIDRAIMAALLICLFRSLTISRTEEMNAYRDAWSLTAQQNDVQQWQWVAQAGACPFCKSMDGSVHDISEDLDSHPNCRCQQRLVTA